MLLCIPKAVQGDMYALYLVKLVNLNVLFYCFCLRYTTILWRTDEYMYTTDTVHVKLPRF